MPTNCYTVFECVTIGILIKTLTSQTIIVI